MTTPPDPNVWLTLEGGVQVAFNHERPQFYEAVQRCLDIGGRVFEPRTVERAELVIGKACDFGLCPIWIGITDAFDEARFTYLSDGGLAPYELIKWGPGEPNNREENEHFVVVYSDGQGNIYRSTDFSADSIAAGLVCEADPGTIF